MSSDDILALLAAEGEIEAHGGFSIDKEKAREKMRQFQLSDPRQYVLMLVQAAVHQGATHVEFQIDADDMEVWFDGEGYSKVDLDDLFVSMFGDRGESNLRSRQELAIALNGALALNPRWVRVWSHRAGESTSLQLRAGAGSLESVKACTPTDARGTRVHVKQRFRPGLALRFVQNLKGTIAEESILKERVRYAELPIILDGGRISSGRRLGNVAGRIDLDEDGIHGCCGFLVDPDPPLATLEVLNAGVWLATHPLPSFPAGFVAMLDSRALRKDVSQTDVVRDDAYTTVIGRLTVALEHSLLSMAKLFADHPTQWEQLPVSLRSRMPTWIAERVSAPWRLKPVGDVLPRYFELPVWQQLDGEWVSTAALQGPGGVDFVSRPRGDREGFGTAVHAESQELRAALRAIFGESLRDRTSAYESAAQRAQQKADLFSRDWSTTLGDGLYLAREPVTGEGIEGEVGIRRSDREESVVHVVYQGKLLETVVLKPSTLHIPGFVAVVQADFEPTADWTRSRRDESFAGALHAVAEATVRAFESVGRTVRVSAEPSLLPSLRVMAKIVCQRNFARTFYLAAGFSKRRSARWVNKFGETAKKDPFEQPHPLLDIPLYPQLAGRPFSLMQLREIHCAEHPVKVLLAGKQRSGAFEGYVICDKVGRVLLRRVLGSDAVVAGEEPYALDLAAQAWRSQPEEPFELFAETAQAVAFAAQGMDVKAGLVVDAGDGEDVGGKASVRVMKERRTIELVGLPCALAGVVMVVDWLEAPVRSDFSGLHGKALPTLQKTVDTAPAELFLAAFEARGERAADTLWNSSLRHLALAPFLQPGWLEAFNGCVDAQGTVDAAERLVTLLRLAAQADEPLPTGTVRDVFDGVASGEPPAADAGLEALVRVIGPVWRRLRGVALLRGFGESRSIAAVLADLDRHDKALVMDASNLPKSAGKMPRVVLVATKAEHAVLGRVFGGRSFADGRVWFDRWRARETFQQQAKVELELPTGEVLVKVEAQGDMDGEIGIPRALPSLASPSAIIVAYRRRRRVCDVAVPEAQASFVGVLQADSFGVERGFTSLSEKDIIHIARVCRAAWPDLAEALRVAWPEFDDEERAWGRAWGRLLLALMVGERGARVLQEPGLAALVELRLFEHLDGTHWGLDAIVDLHAQDEQVYWAGATSDADAVFSPRLVFRDQPNVRPLLQTLLGEVESYDEVRRKRGARDVNRKAAPNMPKSRPDAAEQTAISGRGLIGLLWIDPLLDEGAVALGDAEKIAGYSDVSSLFIVGGGVYGPAVSIDEGWEFVSLDARGGEFLQNKAREMYENVHERFDPLASKRPYAWRRDRDVLQGLVERMHAQWSAGRKPRNGPTRRFYRALKKVPLFELRGGRSVSLEQREKLNQAAPEWIEEVLSPGWMEEVLSPREPDLAVEPPKPKSAPPSFEPAPPTPEAILLDAIRTELRIVRRGSPGIFSHAMLDLLRIAELRSDVLAEFAEGTVVVNARHPVAKLALNGPPELRGRYVSIAASSVFSAFNIALEEVTDDHEIEFHRLHAQHLAT